MRRTLTVILAADVAQYSRLVAEDEEATIGRFRAASVVFTDLVNKHQGSIFNTAGDAILAKFDSAVDAIRCAIDIQDANNAENVQIPIGQKLLFRIGIAIGDVLVTENGDLLGDAVNIAARLEGIAELGGICISEDVRSHVFNKIPLNVVDLGDQNLRNIPRTIRAFKVVPQIQPAPVPVSAAKATRNGRPLLIATIAACVLGPAAVALFGYRGWTGASVEHQFDLTAVPLVSDRVRESLGEYGHEPDYKAIAISREGWGISVGAADIGFAEREALDRCRQRDAKGYCRIYALGNKVVWSKPPFPLPADVHDEPMEPALTADDGKLISWAIPAAQFENYLNGKSHKALAISQEGFWSVTERSTSVEAARLAVERCSDRFQSPCVLLSIDGFPTQRIPVLYPVTGPFTLAGEHEMAPTDKDRVGEIYGGEDWRAVARGLSGHWYAVNEVETEAEAVDRVLDACRGIDKLCSLRAIGNFRIGKRK